nr:MAG TPA: hypothetical protein [Caudoviricetes sp.]
MLGHEHNTIFVVTCQVIFDNSIKNIVNRKFICYNIVQIGGNRHDRR